VQNIQFIGQNFNFIGQNVPKAESQCHQRLSVHNEDEEVDFNEEHDIEKIGSTVPFFEFCEGAFRIHLEFILEIQRIIILRLYYEIETRGKSVMLANGYTHSVSLQ